MTERAGPGVLVGLELVSPRLADDVAFLQHAMGWTAHASEQGHVVLRCAAGRAVVVVPPSLVDVRPGWLPHVLVDDAAAAAARARSAGGTVAVPLRPDRFGFCAVVVSPEGLALGVWTLHDRSRVPVPVADLALVTVAGPRAAEALSFARAVVGAHPFAAAHPDLSPDADRWVPGWSAPDAHRVGVRALQRGSAPFGFEQRAVRSVVVPLPSGVLAGAIERSDAPVGATLARADA